MKMLLVSLVLGFVSSVSLAGTEQDIAQLGKALIANSTQDVRELPYTLKSLQLNAVERDSDGKILAMTFKTADYTKYDCSYNRVAGDFECSKFVCEAVVTAKIVNTYSVSVQETDIKSCQFLEYVRN